jgi:hypothetical protein
MAHTRQSLSEEEREQRRAEQRALMHASVEELRSSTGGRAYLRARRTFHSYSVVIWGPLCRFKLHAALGSLATCRRPSVGDGLRAAFRRGPA